MTSSSVNSALLMYHTEVDDQTNRQKEFSFSIDVDPRDVAKMQDPKSGPEIMQSVINLCTPKMIAAEPWICSGRGDNCMRRATTMLNTPAFWPADPATRTPATVRDLCPIPICDNPTCKAEAQRKMQEYLNDTSDVMQRVKGIDFRENQMFKCESCKKFHSRGNIKRCSRCLAVWYCDSNCQRTHWKIHKKCCSPPK